MALGTRLGLGFTGDLSPNIRGTQMGDINFVHGFFAKLFYVINKKSYCEAVICTATYYTNIFVGRCSLLLQLW